MMKQMPQTHVEKQKDETPSPRYMISEELAQLRNRSLPLMVASRRCFQSQQADESAPSPSSDAKDYIAHIVEHCAKTPDYLLPDTPLKEALFRVLLANGNNPMNAEEISQILTARWAMTAYPRVLTPPVIQRLLDYSESYYCITRLPEEPKAEEGNPP